MRPASKSNQRKQRNHGARAMGQTNIFEMLENWRSAPYDGLRGMPPDWTIENVVVDFMVHQHEVANAIFDGEITLSGAIRCLCIHRKKEQLLREEDLLQEAHKDQEASRVGAILERLKLPKKSKVNDSIAQLARLYEDLKLGKDECHRLWLGSKGAADAQRGAKTLAAARLGHETTHGTPDEKANRWATYQNAVDLLRKEKPSLSWRRIQELVAKDHGISLKTIQRRTTKPK